MKIKSVLSLLLAFSMAAAMSGCGKAVEYTSEVWVDGEDTVSTIEGQDGYYDGSSGSGGGTASNSGNKGNGGSTGNSGSSSKNSGGSSSKNGLNGATVVIAGWGEGPEVKSTNANYSSFAKKVKEIESTYNCKLDYKVIANSVEYKNAFTSAAMSGVKFADIVQLGAGWVYPQHLRNGFLYALDDYVDVTDVGWDQNCMEQSVVNGKHYVLFKVNNFNGIGGIIFNRSVFKKFGVDDPSVYVKNNNWNTETFLKLAKATTGTKDGVTYYGYAMEKANVTNWGKIFGGKDVQYKNGKYTYDPDQKYINGIQFAYDLLNTHKVTPALTAAATTWQSGKAAMSASATYDVPDSAEYIDTADIGWTYYPKGPGESDYYCQYSSSECWGVPSAAKNPEILADIMADFIYPTKTGNTVEARIESQFYDETSYQTAVTAIKKAQQNSTLSPTYTYISTGIGWQDFGITDKIKPQAYIASVKAQAQAELDDVWEQ